MTYEELWHRLNVRYDTNEAKALVRWVLDVRFGMSLTDIICGKVTQLSADDQIELEKIMCRLENGEPVQYVLGTADFYGRSFHVAPGVLIPRPETAELCQLIVKDPIVEQTETKGTPLSILDIGTGSGCIAITLAKEIPHAHVSAWDISNDALRIARENAQKQDAHITFEKEDILRPQQRQTSWHIIVSNPPYILQEESDEMEKNVLDHEPAIALFAPTENPILFYHAIGKWAIDYLNSGGRLFFELNPRTAEEVKKEMVVLGFRDTEILTDQYGKQRFLKAMKR